MAQSMTNDPLGVRPSIQLTQKNQQTNDQHSLSHPVPTSFLSRLHDFRAAVPGTTITTHRHPHAL